MNRSRIKRGAWVGDWAASTSNCERKRFYHRAPLRELAPSTALRRRKSSGGWAPGLRGPETHSLGATPFRGLAPYPSELNRPAGAL